MHVVDNIQVVYVLAGAAEELVTHRELRGHTVGNANDYKKRKKFSEAYYKSRTKEGYQTNRSIKTWATWFVLKSMGTSGVIQAWRSQEEKLLAICKMSKNSFRARLREMIALNLVTDNGSLVFTSYKKAADILGIPYTGLNKIYYNYELQGQQIFQYFLRAEEIRSNQLKQQDALMYHAGKNPLLKDAIIQQLFQQYGSSRARLQEESQYFQEQLLKLQKQAFKEGSPLFDIIHTLRADVNRSCKGIKENHGYKSKQSVSYMKRRMKELEIVAIKKVCVKSAERSRLYVSVPGEKKKRDAYKWLPNEQVTAWFLTDQITPKFQTIIPKQKENEKSKAA